MIKIKEAIVVEGRYDKNTLSQIVDATIFETSGFGIFKDKQQMDLLRRVAEKRGLIVFRTQMAPDSSSAIILRVRFPASNSSMPTSRMFTARSGARPHREKKESWG